MYNTGDIDLLISESGYNASIRKIKLCYPEIIPVPTDEGWHMSTFRQGCFSFFLCLKTFKLFLWALQKFPLCFGSSDFCTTH